MDRQKSQRRLRQLGSPRPLPESAEPVALGEMPGGRRGDPVLRFSPYAWAKLLFFRDRGPTEIGGFGITTADDLLYVEDFITVKQAVTVATVSFDDAAVADFVDGQIDAGRKPGQVLRVWCHTHPGRSPQPSGTDEETFQRVFGQCDHAVMFIMARGGEAYARLRFNVGPGGSLLIPARVDYSRPFAASDFPAWETEYQANVQAGLEMLDPGIGPGWDDWPAGGIGFGGNDDAPTAGTGLPDSILAELAGMEPGERRCVLRELGIQDDQATPNQRQEVLL
jgi:proteasome lid subunit RPN8/RPN11